MTDVLFLVTASLAFFVGAGAVAAFYWRRGLEGQIATLAARQGSAQAEIEFLKDKTRKIDLESVNRRLGELELRRNLR